MIGASTPKRILFLDHAPILGGAEIALLNLIAGLDRRRFTPLVATAQDSPLAHELAAAGIESLAVPFGRLNRAGAAMPANLIRAAWAVAAIVRGRGIAVIHTNTVRAHIVGALAALLTGTRIIWTIHDNTFPPLLVRLLAWIPTRVITVSSWLRDLYGPMGLANKTAVIPNGIRLPARDNADDTIRQELGIPAEAPLVVNVGRLVSGKAPHLFIEAAQLVSKTLPQARFVLVGGPDKLEPGQAPPPYLDTLDRIARSSGLAERLLMVGQRLDAARFYAAADLVAYCAVSSEGLPTVLLEAMCFAKPVVAAATGGAVEIVRDGVTGVLVQPNDVSAMAAAMVQLLTKSEWAREMGLAGQTRLKQEFDLQAQVAKIEQVYHQCLD